ncbi:ABC transporter ATP-binding protein [Salinimicrobium soli]|uniref:ABC transporter ATP-binding protein n=1 Tax=Salinimicrobium soli TaxID=1254399 RepID=UPI003AB08937
MLKDEILVKAEGVSKKFCKDLKTSLWYGIKDLFSNVSGNKEERLLREKEFWAVKDISFELRRGECLGLIGHNGAGKSTLLKILNGLIKPDTGKVTIKGKVGALIELGAGFNPILTGRENIYNNGAILGFTRKEIDEKVEEIIDFAEIRAFIDMPVQHYSSGMKVRLGFAIAAQMEPDVLIIDEVLAVGDIGFVLKCFKTIDRILPKTAVVYVSHSMPQVSRLCDIIILMEQGRAIFQSNEVANGIDLYYSRFAENELQIAKTDDRIELEKIEILEAKNYNHNIAQLEWDSSLRLFLRFKIVSEIFSPILIIYIYDKEQRPVALLKPNCNKDSKTLQSGEILEFQVSHHNLQLSKGLYTLSLGISEEETKAPILRINGVLTFQVIYKNQFWPPFLLKTEYEEKVLQEKIN